MGDAAGPPAKAAAPAPPPLGGPAGTCSGGDGAAGGASSPPLSAPEPACARDADVAEGPGGGLSRLRPRPPSPTKFSRWPSCCSRPRCPAAPAPAAGGAARVLGMAEAAGGWGGWRGGERPGSEERSPPVAACAPCTEPPALPPLSGRPGGGALLAVVTYMAEPSEWVATRGTGLPGGSESPAGKGTSLRLLRPRVREPPGPPCSPRAWGDPGADGFWAWCLPPWLGMALRG